MRLGFPCLLAMLLAAPSVIAPSMAAAQDQATPRRHAVVIPPSAAGAPAAVKRAPSPVPSPAPRPAAFSRLQSGPPSQCRAQCADTRYTCLTQDANGDGGDCNTRWSQCTVACGATGYRYSSTAPQVFTQGFAPR